MLITEEITRLATDDDAGFDAGARAHGVTGASGWSSFQRATSSSGVLPMFSPFSIRAAKGMILIYLINS